MIFYVLAILYVISMLYILLVEIWYFLSIFICRKKTNCQFEFCPVRRFCSKAPFTEKEINEIRALLSKMEEERKPET